MGTSILVVARSVGLVALLSRLSALARLSREAARVVELLWMFSHPQLPKVNLRLTFLAAPPEIGLSAIFRLSHPNVDPSHTPTRPKALFHSDYLASELVVIGTQRHWLNSFDPLPYIQ